MRVRRYGLQIGIMMVEELQRSGKRSAVGARLSKWGVGVSLLLCIFDYATLANGAQGSTLNAMRIIKPIEITPLETVFPGGLYRPGGMASSSTGLVCVADTGNHRVLVINEDLELVVTIGKEGNGPGELRRPVQCITNESDEVLILDSSQNRLSRFTIRGDLLDTSALSFWPSSTALFGDGAILTVSRDSSAIALRQPAAYDPELIQVAPPPCAGLSSSAWGMTFGVSPDGVHAVFVRTSPCTDSDYTLFGNVDVAAKSARVRTVTVYDDFRQETTLRRKGRGEQYRVVLRAAATDGRRHYVLHAYSKRSDDLSLVPLDIFLPGRDRALRTYIALSARAPRLTRMTATASGDLLIIDDNNGALIRIDEADIRAVLER